MNLELFSNMPTITFFIRANYLYCRVRINNTVAEFSTKEKIEKKYWNQKLQRYKSPSLITNQFIDTLTTDCTYKLKTKSIALPELTTAKELVEIFQRKDIKVYIADIIRSYIDNCTATEGTIENHLVKLNNLFEFQQEIGTKLTTESFDLRMCNRFVEWFITSRRTMNKTTANRNVLFYRQTLVWWQKKGNKIESELLLFVAERDKQKTPVFLDKIELEKLQETKLISFYLTRIKDLFLFQCYTGLSYCDLWSDWTIKQEEFGTLLIGNRGKNGQRFWLPVEYPIVQELLEKYGGVLPHYENAVYNRVLKEIAAICGIDKRITTHTARKTFATLMDADGWTRETVSKMLGHKSIKTTEVYYIGESFARLENEMILRNVK